MKAVILCAGKSTRMYPLTVHRPKQALPVLNKPLVLHTAERLFGIVDEIIVVVGENEQHIRKALSSYKGKVTFVKQAKPTGTGAALLSLKGKLTGQFLVLNGDDLYGKADLQKLSRQKLAVLACASKTPEQFGVVLKKGVNLDKIVEKPRKAASNLVNTGAYALTEKIFSFSPKKSARGEIELTDMVQALAKTQQVKVVAAKEWHSLTYPWSLLDIHEKLLSDLQSDIKGVVERFVTIKGSVVVGKGSVIKSGTYIEGPVVIGENCSIGPNAYIRAGSVIGHDVKIGNAVEIKNTIVMANSSIGHLSYVGDSVVGEHVNLGAGTITANLRHDDKTVSTPVKGVMVDTCRRKLGAVIADNVHTGIHTSIYPGRKIWPGKTTLPGEIVTKDVE